MSVADSRRLLGSTFSESGVGGGLWGTFSWSEAGEGDGFCTLIRTPCDTLLAGDESRELKREGLSGDLVRVEPDGERVVLWEVFSLNSMDLVRRGIAWT